jgi:hypothetical protein
MKRYETLETLFGKVVCHLLSARAKSLHASIEKLGAHPTAEKIGEVMKLKTEGEEAFSEAVTNQGKAEHERSHLLESYGELILALQKLENSLNSDVRRT